MAHRPSNRLTPRLSTLEGGGKGSLAIYTLLLRMVPAPIPLIFNGEESPAPTFCVLLPEMLHCLYAPCKKMGSQQLAQRWESAGSWLDWSSLPANLPKKTYGNGEWHRNGVSYEHKNIPFLTWVKLRVHLTQWLVASKSSSGYFRRYGQHCTNCVPACSSLTNSRNLMLRKRI